LFIKTEIETERNKRVNKEEIEKGEMTERKREREGKVNKLGT
jgi:hypothetical protein